MQRHARVGLAMLLGLALAVASRWYERVGPAPRAWDEELCSLTPPRSCRDGTLQAGWPLAYLRDRPGVSRVGQLALIEDELRPWAVGLDILIFGVLSWLLLRVRTPRGENATRPGI